MNLILLEANEVDHAGGIRLTGAQAMHLMHVLRVAPGQRVRLGILDGPRGTGLVQSVTGTTIELHGTFDGASPARPDIDLLLALPRPKVLRRLWAQLAALGVGQIILTNAERVERNYFDTHVLTPECYRPLLVEGLQQARDTRLPVVSIHRQFKVLIEDDLDGLLKDGLRLVADPLATETIAAVVDGTSASGYCSRLDRKAVGTSSSGTSSLRTAFTPSAWGPNLRTDTACIALLALAHASMS